jgi:hypothetical protein
MTETATIEIPVYRTPEGRHTCQSSQGSCQLLKCVRFGSIFTCGWHQEEVSEGPDGYLTPCSGCPIKQEVQP